jgi:glycosyltransferase involved in cell wall biosynthesis
LEHGTTPKKLMPTRRFKVLAVASHPVQYMAPLFRLMASEPALDLHVAYCSLRGAQAALDPDFQVSVEWDLPLLDGYSWSEIPNRGSGNESFWGLRNPGLKSLIRDGEFDAVLCYLGYVCASFWIVRNAAKAAGSAFLFGTDAHSLQPRDGKSWKRPLDLLRAFSEAAVERSILVFAGDGPERCRLQEEAAKLDVLQRVRFLGFVNQSQLPAVYSSADVMVLPSDYEPFAVVVNEAMCCGCPVVASDRVGAARDLVAPLGPGFVFPVGGVAALARILRSAFSDREKLRERGCAGAIFVETHSPTRTVAATVEAIGKAVERVSDAP